jgi:hypothetical protein
MWLHNSTAENFVPDGKPLPAALKRITHLGVGAHQDGLEFMAFQGILDCHASKSKCFGGNSHRSRLFIPFEPANLKEMSHRAPGKRLVRIIDRTQQIGLLILNVQAASKQIKSGG